MNRRRGWGSVAFVTALSVTSAASAQGDPCAQRIHDGVALRRAGRDAEALELFRAGLETCPGARMRVQLAWAEQALGRWVAASEHLREALATSDPWVNERRARLEGDLEVIERHLGRLELLGGVEGAAVFLDGAPAGELPWREPRAFVAGTVRLEVRREGYYPVSREAVVTSGQVTREQIEMRPEAPARVDPPARVETLPPPVVTPPPVRVTPPVVTPPREDVVDRGGPRRLVAWTLAGVGAAGLVAGAVTWGLRESSAAEFNAAHGAMCFEHAGAGYGGAECEPLRARTAAYQTATIVSLTAGAALGAAAAVVFLTAPRRRERAAAGLRCAPSLDGVVCAGVF